MASGGWVVVGIMTGKRLDGVAEVVVAVVTVVAGKEGGSRVTGWGGLTGKGWGKERAGLKVVMTEVVVVLEVMSMIRGREREKARGERGRRRKETEKKENKNRK